VSKQLSVMRAFRRQTAIMEAAIQRLEDKGYLITLHGLNRFAEDDRYLYRYFLGALDDWVLTWSKKQGRRFIVVRVFPQPKDNQSPLDGKLTFAFRVRRLVVYRPLIATLNLMSQQKARRSSETRGTGFLLGIQGSDYCEYRGTDRSALKTVLNILEMPQHREILLSRSPRLVTAEEE
jgi:hypothetical protein